MTSLFLPPATVRAATVSLPGSKSISNRVLLLAALSDNVCRIERLLRSDDTERMLEALNALGVRIDDTGGDTVTVHGTAGRFPQSSANLFLGNAGTAFRPLTAVLAVLGGDYFLHGVPRMHQRPIGDLVDALREAGASIEYAQNPGFPPLRIGGFTDNGNRLIPVDASVSGQFLTALLIALPLRAQAYTVEVRNDLVSAPYIGITLSLMARFGVTVENRDFRLFRLPGKTSYHAPERFLVEGDASGASYFSAAGLLGHAPVRVLGIGRNSVQGDAAFVDVLRKLGAEVVRGDDFVEVSAPENHVVPAFDIDAKDIPDAAMTLAPVALAANGRSIIRNIGSWRVKETDRIAAMATELRKFGAEVEEGADFIAVTPPERLPAAVTVDTYDDHRMAMCFSLASLLGVAVTVNNPECVQKTFPRYFEIFCGSLVRPR